MSADAPQVRERLLMIYVSPIDDETFLRFRLWLEDKANEWWAATEQAGKFPKFDRSV